MNLEQALKTEGWMNTSDLEWLAGHASQSKNIVEIGSWMGRSCRVMADNTDGVVYAVDMWDPKSLSPFVKVFTMGHIGYHPDGYLWEQFQKNLSDHISTGKVIPIRLSSTEAAKHLSGIEFDLIFIDADHEYESVLEDIKAWLPLLKSGGVISGHDYHLLGVSQAVADTIGPVKVVPGNNIWWKRI